MKGAAVPAMKSVWGLVGILAVIPAQKTAYLNVRGVVSAIVNRIVLQVVIADAKVATGAPGVLDYNLLLIVVVIALVHVLVLVELVPDAVD
jgi:hypothetical protein